MSTDQENSLRAGAALVDITPDSGTHLSGSGAGQHRPAQSILDPLHARAIAFEANGKQVCVLALDLCIITEAFTDAVRREASGRFGLDPAALMVHAVQSHSAPSCGPFMLDPDFPLHVTSGTEFLFGSESSTSCLRERGRGLGFAHLVSRIAVVAQEGLTTTVPFTVRFPRGVGSWPLQTLRDLVPPPVT